MTERELQTIVVGTDFNELAASALRFAGHIAARAGAELIVVYADTFEPPTEFTTAQVHQIAKSIERSREHAHTQLERHIADHVVRGVKVKGVVVERAPATAITSVAASEDADLIVLGTHGRGGLQRLIVGSVAETVMREAGVPVLTVRSTATPGVIRRVLCPVNSSEVASIAVDRAMQIARAVDAELTLLYVTRPGEPEPRVLPDESGTGARVKIVKRQSDDPAEEILTVESNGEFDLIVIGAEHKLVRDVTMFGSTTASVTRHARTPVLTVTRRAARPSANETIGAQTHVV